MKKFVRLPNSIKEIVCGYDEKTFKELNYKMSDVLEQLIDVFIAVSIDGKKDLYRSADYTTKYLAENKIYIKEIYGAIWVNGEKDEPTLKSVARLNENGGFVLL